MARSIVTLTPKLVSVSPLNMPDATTLSMSLCAQYVTGTSAKLREGQLSPNRQPSFHTATTVTSDVGIVMYQYPSLPFEAVAPVTSQ